MGNKYARNILFLLPSYDWGTKERAAFKDITLAKKHGYNVFVCGYEDSLIVNSVKSLEVEIVPFKEHFLNRFTGFHRHFSLGKIQRVVNLDIVHCYDLSLLFSMSFQLKTENLTSLVISVDHVIDKPLQRFWYRPLISRIDSLILINKNLKQDALGNLGLAVKKIEYFGMGLKPEDKMTSLENELNFEIYKDYNLAGTFVSPSLENSSQLVPLFSALKVLNEKNSTVKKNKLVLLSAVPFQKLTYLSELMNMVREHNIEEDLLFVSAHNIPEVIEQLDLWITYCPNALIEDFALSAIMNEVPAIMIRNFCTKDLLEDYEGVGDTYKLSDARELRDKWEKMLLGQAVFQEKTRLYKYFIEREHAYKHYKTSLLALYSRIVLRRARLFSKK